MKREFDRLENGPFDLLVIGGGIYGAWIACDAALRGLSVALVERDDWGSGTSQASSKLIHGGLRYLEHFKFGLVQRSLAERRRLATLAPHRVHPLTFALPVYRGDRVGKLRLEAGLWLYDRLAGGGQPVPPHRRFSRRETLERYPFLKAEGLSGGFTYGDCGTDDARFTLEVVAAALHAGAACVNHAGAAELIHEGGRVAGALVEDGERGAAVPVRARVTVNAAGPWAGRIKGMPPAAQGLMRLVKGVHLILPPLPTADAFLLTARRDGRVFFLIPWYGHTLLGTTDTDYHGDPGQAHVEQHDIDYLLEESGRALGGHGWRESDLRGAFAGVRTLQGAPDASPTDVTREWSLEEPEAGMLMPVGGKFTSARAEAALTVERACAVLGRPAGACPTKRRPFAWCPPGDYAEWQHETERTGTDLGLDGETAYFAARRYGSAVYELFHLLRERHGQGLGRRIVDDAPFCRGEIVHAAHAEMARTLEDILRRRVPLAVLARVDDDALTLVADLAGETLGWDAARRAAEIKAFRKRHGHGH